MIVVAKNLSVLQLFISRMPKMAIFSTNQSKLTFQNLVMACLQLVYLYVTLGA